LLSSTVLPAAASSTVLPAAASSIVLPAAVSSTVLPAAVSSTGLPATLEHCSPSCCLEHWSPSYSRALVSQLLSRALVSQLLSSTGLPATLEHWSPSYSRALVSQLLSPRNHLHTPATMRGSTVQTLVYAVMLLVMLLLLYRYTEPTQVNHLQCLTAIEELKVSLTRTVKEELGRKSPQDPKLPTIYIITPTYRRPEQMPELIRFAQTLMNVPNIHWIVADDANTTNYDVVDYLTYSSIPHTYLLTPMPEKYKQLSIKPKGVANRNGGLMWVREHATSGVVYFADDDNTYDIRLFQEIRYTERVSMFPVGLVTKAGLSSPVLKNGKFHGWYDGWIAKRKFPVDMAGFAVSVQYLLKMQNAEMPYKAGYEEDGFLRSLKIEPEEIEFKADKCTKIYVWHTQTKKNGPSQRTILQSKYNGTNLRILEKKMMIES
ncbi:hypothetical protein OTU49_017482, partial [Cherax quadricarinatus]